MGEVTGLGGAFLRARDPEALYAWYEQHLGMQRVGGSFIFSAEAVTSDTVLAFFPQETKYFGVSGQAVMLNLRVDDLDSLLTRLRAAGVDVDPKQEDHEYGRFAWFNDLEGNRVELWQPPASA